MLDFSSLPPDSVLQYLNRSGPSLHNVHISTYPTVPVDVPSGDIVIHPLGQNAQNQPDAIPEPEIVIYLSQCLGVFIAGMIPLSLLGFGVAAKKNEKYNPQENSIQNVSSAKPKDSSINQILQERFDKGPQEGIMSMDTVFRGAAIDLYGISEEMIFVPKHDFRDSNNGNTDPHSIEMENSKSYKTLDSDILRSNSLIHSIKNEIESSYHNSKNNVQGLNLHNSDNKSSVGKNSFSNYHCNIIHDHIPSIDKNISSETYTSYEYSESYSDTSSYDIVSQNINRSPKETRNIILPKTSHNYKESLEFVVNEPGYKTLNTKNELHQFRLNELNQIKKGLVKRQIRSFGNHENQRHMREIMKNEVIENIESSNNTDEINNGIISSLNLPYKNISFNQQKHDQLNQCDKDVLSQGYLSSDSNERENNELPVLEEITDIKVKKRDSVDEELLGEFFSVK